ncbi:MAG: RNA polymerase sigma factor SigZ [Balneolaceae bacterium]
MNTESIWKNFHDQLLAFIVSKVGNRELAHDLLQEVFVKIHLNLPSLKSSDALSSWVFSIARNVIIDNHRKAKVEQKMEREVQSFFYDDSESSKPDEYCEECLQPFIDELPPEFKEAILATDLGSLTQKEYAEQIGLSYSGLKSRVQRGRKQLNTLFSNCCTQRDLTQTTRGKILACGCPA